MKPLLLSIGLLTAVCRAQTAPPNPWALDQHSEIEWTVRRWMLENGAPWDPQLVERRAAEQRRKEFVERANRFVAAWNKVMGAYSRNGTFNVKDARELSKAFRALQSTGWPK